MAFCSLTKGFKEAAAWADALEALRRSEHLGAESVVVCNVGGPGAGF